MILLWVLVSVAVALFAVFSVSTTTFDESFDSAEVLELLHAANHAESMRIPRMAKFLFIKPPEC